MNVNRRSVVIIFAVVLLGIVALTAFYNKKSAAPEYGAQVIVMASFYPLGFLAEEVGGDRVSVRTVIPSGAEPHDYEPTPLDVKKAHSADIFIYNGARFDKWAEQLAGDLASSGVEVVSMAEALKLTRKANAEFMDSGESQHEEVIDPHFWLDPVLMQRAAEIVRDALIAKDPDGQAFYQKKTEDFRSLMQALDAKYREGLSSCQLREIVTSHDAFEYLADRYGFKVLAISGVSPEAEPSPKRLTELTQLVRREKIDYVFFETLVSPAVSETLAREAGAKTLVLDPIESLSEKEKQGKASYFSIMEQNLQNLKLALKCR